MGPSNPSARGSIEGDGFAGSGEYVARDRVGDAGLDELVHGLGAIVWEAEAVPFLLRFVSRGAEALLGYPVARWLERPERWPEILPPGEGARLARLCDECVAEDRDVEHELVARTASGEERWLRGSIRVARDAAGHPFRLRGVLVDVTERARAEAELRARDRSIHELVAGLDEAVFRADPAGTMTYVGGAFARMFPAVAREAVGASLVDLCHPDDRDRVRSSLAGLRARSREHVRLELRADPREPLPRWLELRARPLLDDAGHVVEVLGTLADVTDQRRARQRAQQSDRIASIGAMAAGVAHELNSPLGVVAANLEIVQSSVEAHARGERALLSALAAELGPERARAILARARGGAAGGLDDLEAAVREARTGAERAGAVIREIKAFSRADDEGARGPIDVRRVLEAELDLARAGLRTRARLVTQLDAVPPVDATAARLAQVFRALVAYAIARFPDGHPEQHELTATTAVDAAGRVRVELHDTAEALGVDAVDRLLEPVDPGTAARAGAHALASVSGIVAALGGELVVESHPGLGTRFTILLRPARTRTPLGVPPRLDPPPTQRDPVAPPAPVDPEPPPTRREPGAAAARDPAPPAARPVEPRVPTPRLPTAPARLPSPVLRAPPVAVRAPEPPPVAPAPARPRVLVADDEPLIGTTVRRALGRAYEVVAVESALAALELVRGGERFDVVLSDLMMPGMTGMALHAEIARIAPDLAGRMVFMTGGAFTPAARDFLDGVSNARLDKPFSIDGLRRAVEDELARRR